MQVDDRSFDGIDRSSVRGFGPYEPSIASSASSSQASIFSDAGSAQSSDSSLAHDDSWNVDDVRERLCAQAHLLSHPPPHADWTASVGQTKQVVHSKHVIPARSYADITSVPAEQRQHPRRCSLPKNQKPPTLQRQCERKLNFVDNLVDSATQMVETIWPLSIVPCRSEKSSGRGLLPLRTYVEETLRRSRTSYSTLQVALYYLILIKPSIPQTDFTQEQSIDCPASRALMCGRRMFLAALILASKYLQDRNYSAKAWSKMSGLNVTEINTNERTFLSKVGWKLHISEPIFNRWTEIVLKYTPNAQPPSPGASLAVPLTSWSGIIPLLTPELDRIPLPESKMDFSSQCTGTYAPTNPIAPTPTRGIKTAMHIDSTSHESTPTPTNLPPRFLEPKPDMLPPTPALARMGPLPTPQMTPSSVASSTPAVSACGSRRPSICSAMAMVQKVGFNRCAVDAFPAVGLNKDDCRSASRRPSIMSIASSRSSPESLISDISRSSRASSICSVSTVSSNASLALNRACLARMATCRNARPPMPPATVAEEREGTQWEPIVISDDTEMISSPEIDFTPTDKALHNPHKHSKHAALPVTAAQAMSKSRKRSRPQRGNRRSEMHEEVRLMLEEASELMDIDDDDDDDNDGSKIDADGQQCSLSPSPAATYARRKLSRSQSGICGTKEAQPPASLSQSDTCRMPLQRREGTKRTCCSTSARRHGSVNMSISPSPLYGEVA